MLSARKSMQSSRGQDGFTLIEVMLGVAGMMTLAAGGFYLYQVTNENASVRVEQENVRTITTTAQKLYGSTGSYTGLTTVQAINDGVPPRSMVSGSGLLSKWRQPVMLAPVAVDGKANSGLQVTYSSVPSGPCTKFASRLADGMWDVQVGGVSVLATEGTRVLRGRVDPVRVAQRCANGAPVVLTYHRLESGLTGAILPPVVFPAPPGSIAPPAGPGVPPSVPPVAPPPPPGTTPIAPPPSLAPSTSPPPPGAISILPPGTAPTSPPPPPSTPPPAGSPGCVIPSPSTRSCSTTCTDGTNGYETQVANNTFSCPSGQLISTAGPVQYQSSGPQTRSEQRYRNENATCPDPFAAPVWNAGAWQAWSATSAWSPAYACAPTCSAPPPSVTTTPQSQTATCPSGQVTTAGSSTFGQTRTRTNTTDYSCSTPIGPVVAAPATYTYSPWSPLAGSVCFAACVAPPSVAQTQAGTPGSQTLACPSGQSGSITQSRTTTQSRTITYSCPAPTGAYSTTTPPWSAPGAPYGTWTTTSNTCATNCVAPPTQNTTQSQTFSCPLGQSIATSGPSFGNSSGPQTRTATTTYSCPAPTGSFTTSPTTYTPWSPAYTCTPTTAPPPSCGPAPAPGSRTLDCPLGQTGSISQVHGWNSAAAPTCWAEADWTTTENTCAPTGPAPCNIPNGTTRNWIVNDSFCEGPGVAAQTIASGTSKVWADNTAPTTGSAGFLCTDGVLSVGANPGATCNSPAPPGCPPAPASRNRTVACVAPESGPGYTQTSTWSAVAAPTCWTETWTTTGGNCTTDAPPVTPACPGGVPSEWACSTGGEVGNSCRFDSSLSLADRQCSVALGTLHSDPNFGGKYNYDYAEWPGQLICPPNAVCDPVFARCKCP